MSTYSRECFDLFLLTIKMVTFHVKHDDDDDDDDNYYPAC